VSDHAVVAMVGDGIRQTRCTTCDTEHEYRQAKVPPGRKKTAVALPPKPPAAVSSIAAPKPPEPGPVPDGDEGAPAAAADGPDPASGQGATTTTPLPVQEGHVHRRLIRAVLPRIEGEMPTRQAPEFTMHRPLGQRPAPPGRPPRQNHGGQPRQGSAGVGGHSRHPGSRSGGGAPAAGARGGRGGHAGQSGQPNRSGSRPGRPPHGGGQGPRKKH
jgi:translation initiation factor IF-2